MVLNNEFLNSNNPTIEEKKEEVKDNTLSHPVQVRNHL